MNFVINLIRRRQAMEVSGLVCLPLSISRLWELRRSLATAAISFVSVRLPTYTCSDIWIKSEGVVCSKFCLSILR